MPATRSQAAASSSPSRPERHDDSVGRGASEFSDAREHPPHTSAEVSQPGPAASDEQPYESTAAASDKNTSRPSSSSRPRPPSSPDSGRRSYQDRERSYRQPHPSGTQDHLFSPPPYKVR